MILDIYKDYSVSELNTMANETPKRYQDLCQIVGEFALAVKPVYLWITLPFGDDKGCVTISHFKATFDIVDMRYF